ncbi:Probable conserved lipoprotein LppM [Mycobacteroides abscessus subsp. abscessus]|nr:Probable conserved lipoprotein LppM [Mycobacteroides abscessus subsp. abscessus]
MVVLEGRADLTALGDNSNADVSLAVSFPGDIESTNGEMLGSDSVQWKLNPGVVSSFTATARYTDPSTRSFNGAAIFVSIAALLVGALVASMAWLDRDQSPRFTPEQFPE